MTVSADDPHSFPRCLHYLGAAMHINGVAPQVVRITMPFDDWWRLYQALDRSFPRAIVYDGRGKTPNQFQYNGFTFVGNI